VKRLLDLNRKHDFASLRRADTRDALRPQGWLYTVAVRDAAGEALQVVGAVRDILVAPEDLAALLARMTDPAVRIVSLTVTEKGYCHDPATGELDTAHPDIRHDLAHPETPRSTPGFLVEALARRRVSPFTVLCCDNLPANGRTVARIVHRAAELRDPELAAWIAGEVAFPSTMVDRIVPATTGADRTRIAARLGLEDAWPVVTEPFSQWIIEDRFPTGRPAWEEVGAVLAAEVEPYERMKLRLLNGSHSALAYLGCLAGLETVAETVADPGIGSYLGALMRDEIAPTLDGPAGIDLDGYIAALLARFANPALRHRTAQIAMDGSQKLPQRLLGTIRDRLARGLPIPRLALAVAAWMRFVAGVDERGRALRIDDPLADRLRAAAGRAEPSPERLILELLGIAEIFGADLPQDARFTAAVADALRLLHEQGARAAAARAAPAGA
jgi:fructuronate reductase